MKDEKKSPRSSRVLAFLLFSSFILHPSSFASAAATQKQVLQSINDSVGASVDGTNLLAFTLAVVALVLFLAIIANRKQRAAVPKEVNHQGKLLKEIARGMNLKPAEVRQLKLLADGEELSSPLVLVLCPSLMAKAAGSKAEWIDQRVVAGLARKMMVNRDTQSG